ncbi:MAG: hypothetical protein ACOX2L_00630 [Anaerolineae bacterium]|jgi:hypothetical protein|nr:hypothetical protein [Chloroflexota bacterium]
MYSEWMRNGATQEAIKRFLLALVILGLALMGYDVEIRRQPAPLSTPLPAAGAPQAPDGRGEAVDPEETLPGAPLPEPGPKGAGTNR